jgi:hypothetical protein
MHELTRMAEDGKVSPTPIDRYECCHDGCNSFVKQSTKIYVEGKMLPYLPLDWWLNPLGPF